MKKNNELENVIKDRDIQMFNMMNLMKSLDHSIKTESANRSVYDSKMKTKELEIE